MKIMIVFGTRPEAIKMAPLVLMLKKNSLIETYVCVTGQHREMLDQVLNTFELKPDYDLGIMTPGQSLTGITTKILEQFRSILIDLKPDLTVVHGDTSTAFAASLASYYEKIPVAHVEAGLRTGNIYSPWPEEANRKLISCLSAIHLAPTLSSYKNLINEGISSKAISVTGNTVVDSLLNIKDKIESSPLLKKSLEDEFSDILKHDRFILVTAHRRENYGEGFSNIADALKTIALRFPDIAIVFPVHPNPSVKDIVLEKLSNLNNVFLLNPLDYLPFVFLLSRSFIVLTDSGGIQEEAPTFGKPVLVMRDVTERPEAIDAGTVKLIGSDKEVIISSVVELINNLSMYDSMARAHNPYGDGKASQRIIDHILLFLNAREKI
jgi:UDP-N-acetylglucosamine 2-epimerase (non-hydrolysing)